MRAVTQRIGHCKERLERQKEQHGAKEEDARAALSLAERQWGELSEERERHERQQARDAAERQPGGSREAAERQ